MTNEFTMTIITSAVFRIGDIIRDVWNELYKISRIELNEITMRRMEMQDDTLILTDEEVSMPKDEFECAFCDEIERRKRWWDTSYSE